MDKTILASLWAKTDKNDDTRWHPLILHLLDVGAVVEIILAREPKTTRNRMAACLGMKWEDALPWILLLTACHDLGKACPGFQCKWSKAPNIDLPMPRSPDTKINHAFVTQIALTEILQEKGWPFELADLVSDAVGCHHGSRATPTTLFNLQGNARAIGRGDWIQARRELMETMMEVFTPTRAPAKQTLSGPDFMLLSGLASFADWIGSNEEWFPFGGTEDCKNLSAWYQKRKIQAGHALDTIGWEFRTPLSPEPKTFEQAFGFTCRPLQQAVIDALNELHEPAVFLLEAPMGEGKTEAAFFAHMELQRRLGHRGLYVALPTKATGNAMFERTLDFLSRQGAKRTIDMQLLHGGTLLNDTFQNLRLSGIHDPETGGEVRAGEWFTHKKRALLSEYGVGTVDQALLPILPVRHNFVRLWGLANRVVIFDEIHAYDAYTGTLLGHLLRWLISLGSSIVLLSATLPETTRRKIAEITGANIPEGEETYPRLSVFCPGKKVYQKHFSTDPARRRVLLLKGISPDLPAMHAALNEHLTDRGAALALVNTVQRAQELYELFHEGEPLERMDRRVGKRLADGTEVYLFHARFPAECRQQRENQALDVFGGNAKRDSRKILIATQVAEQSLDLDFDLLITDLAPIDLILQRAGRLWRHTRSSRPIDEPVLIIAGLIGGEPPPFGKPLWWGSVYREDLLIRTWSLLRNRRDLTLPDEIDDLVQAVYEEKVEVTESLQERLENALVAEEGEIFALQAQAHQAIIGFPDDASWNDPSRFVLFDEDEPGVHRDLMAKTRLGEESVIAIPLFANETADFETPPSFSQAKQWFLRGISVSRKSVVRKFHSLGVPESWKQSSLLRNCFPMVLNKNGEWIEDSTVCMDEDLGFIYDPKEIK